VTPCRASGRQKAQFSDWKIPFFKKLEKLLTHGTTGTQHRNGEWSAGKWRGGNQTNETGTKIWV
jgi:hypothetical protein